MAKLELFLLGQFKIVSDKGVITEETLHSNKLMRLLSYILINRGRVFMVQELSDVQWSEEDIGNPAGALKNLMYRLRNALSVLGDENYILTKRGAYSWNPDIEVHTDYEQFEQIIRQVKEVEREQKQACLEQALKLYQGPFPEKITGQAWMVSMDTYYHSVYLSAVKELAEIYNEKKEWQKLHDISSFAAKLDSMDEELHYWILKSLIGQNKQELAIRYYENVTQMLYNYLGVKSTEKLRSLYQDIISLKDVHLASIHDIYIDITEKKNPEGVFFCEYPIFREIYRLEARRLSRMGMSEFLLLVTLEIDGSKEMTEEMLLFYKKRGMEKMKDTLVRSLRVGDIAARYGEMQYVILLPTCTFEFGMNVAKRIESNYNKIMRSKCVCVKTELEEVAMAAKW